MLIIFSNITVMVFYTRYTIGLIIIYNSWKYCYKYDINSLCTKGKKLAHAFRQVYTWVVMIIFTNFSFLYLIKTKKRKHQLSHYKIFVVENICCRAKWHIIVCLAFIHSSQYLHSQDEKSNQYLLTFPLIQNDFLLQQIISCAHFTSWCYVENTMGHLNLCWDYDSKVESKTRYAFFLSLKCCTTKISCCIVEFIFAKNMYTFLTKIFFKLS